MNMSFGHTHKNALYAGFFSALIHIGLFACICILTPVEYYRIGIKPNGKNHSPKKHIPVQHIQKKFFKNTSDQISVQKNIQEEKTQEESTQTKIDDMFLSDDLILVFKHLKITPQSIQKAEKLKIKNRSKNKLQPTAKTKKQKAILKTKPKVAAKPAQPQLIPSETSQVTPPQKAPEPIAEPITEVKTQNQLPKNTAAQSSTQNNQSTAEPITMIFKQEVSDCASVADTTTVNYTSNTLDPQDDMSIPGASESTDIEQIENDQNNLFDLSECDKTGEIASSAQYEAALELGDVLRTRWQPPAGAFDTDPVLLITVEHDGRLVLDELIGVVAPAVKFAIKRMLSTPVEKEILERLRGVRLKLTLKS